MEKRERKSRNSYIYFAIISTSLTAFATGVSFVWTSPFLPKFQSSDLDRNPVGHPVSVTESAWIVSAMSFGLLFGPFLSIFTQKWCTKKQVLLIAVLPTLMSHLICSVANRSIHFMAARFLMGVSAGAIWCVLGSYVAEISEDKNRGFMGMMPGILSNFGSWMVYLIGPYLNMLTFSLINLVPLILFYIGFGLFVPDSPYDLVSKNQERKAMQSLVKFRQNCNVEKELEFVKETIEMKSIESLRLSDVIKDKIFIRGVIICSGLMACQQLSGVLAVVCYAEIIFKSAGDFIPSEIGPMILGLVSTLSNAISSFLVDRMGRKHLLTISCMVEAISLFSLGIYFHRYNAGADVSAINWVPITSMMLFMIAFNFGLSTIPWIVTGEVFHSNVKALASTIVSLSNFSLSFAVTMCFPYLVEAIGMAWTFWVFALLMVLGTLFCMLILPETKGKNFQEIQELFKE